MLSLDTGALGSALIVTLVAIVTYYLTRQHFSEWETGVLEDGKPRGFERLTGKWPVLFQVSGAVGAFAAFFTYVRFDGYGIGVQSYASLVLGILTFFMTFMGWTDLYTMKAPAEMSNLCFCFIAPLGLAGLIFSQASLTDLPLPFAFGNPYLDHWLQFIITLVLFTVLMYMIVGVAFGGGDAVALIIGVFGITPLVGFFPTFYIFGAACLIQVLLLFIFAPLFGWGRKVEDPFKKWRQRFNRLIQRIFRTQRELIPPYSSRQAPMLPAIGAAFLLGGLLIPGISLF